MRFLPIRKPWPEPMYFYSLPTFGQARRVAWDKIRALIPDAWIKRELTSSMVIETVFGSRLFVVGMDKPQRVEGDQWDGCVIDESSDQRPKVFDLSVRPALSHKTGWCWRIGVPKRYGSGAAEFKRFFDSGDPDLLSLSWPSSDILPSEEVEAARRQLDERDFAEQYGASWQERGGLIFWAFSEANVSSEVQYNSDRRIVVGSDFNVDPMSWVVGHRGPNGLEIFDELFLRNTSTRQALDELHRRWGNHSQGFEFFGDASGKARKTSASSSDYAQIKNDPRFTPSWVYYPKGNPPLRDRFAACNALFRNAAGESRFKVHPRCIHLIKDLEERAWREGTSEPEDAAWDAGHMTDALGYIIHRVWPIRYELEDEEEPRVSTYGP